MGLGSIVTKGASMLTSTLGKASSGIVAGSEKLLGSGKLSSILGKTGKGALKVGGAALGTAGTVAVSGAKGLAGVAGSAVGSLGGSNLLKLGGIAGLLTLLSNDKLMSAISSSLGKVGDGVKDMGSASKTKAETASTLSKSSGDKATVSSELQNQSAQIKSLDSQLGNHSSSSSEVKGSQSGVPGVASLDHQMYSSNLQSNANQALLNQQQLEKQESKSSTQDEELRL